MNKQMSIEEAEALAKYAGSEYPQTAQCAKQLADTMRCLNAFYYDTMYRDSPGLHDMAAELLGIEQNPHKHSDHIPDAGKMVEDPSKPIDT